MNGQLSRAAAAARAIVVLSFTLLVALIGAAPALVAPAIADAGMYGDPGKAAQYWEYQSYNNNCALVSVAGVVGQITGHMPSEQEVIDLAKSTPSVKGDGRTVYEDESGGGVVTQDLPPLLLHYGVHSNISNDAQHDAALTKLEGVLGSGHAVMVGVHGKTIWDNAPPGPDDHELVVTGIDATNGLAHLNDSGAENGRDLQVPIPQFMSAWSADEFEMTVTSETVQ
ncbi:hypothetical protein A4G31_06040 [Mycobacterium rhizamassiliense]|jgi:hypothetical protein|uniref:Peptidase C39-like domain-containing protein n=1 Tax=Mycobacterium rhizamassiliense TaxID=1841860 RepID=A0A2U3NWJ9_9MYCO|nr:hypothetical protein [Mycobacterium rhizamassiliense]SPM35858.1 hypothetical protein A4G31_06040 [Mycobacterium rhizamassiliense]